MERGHYGPSGGAVNPQSEPALRTGDLKCVTAPSGAWYYSPDMGRGRGGVLYASLIVALWSAGCAVTYRGTARDFDPREVLDEPGWLLLRDVQPLRQETESDCGAAALAMVLNYWQAPTSGREVYQACGSPAGGIRAADLSAQAKKRGLKSFVIQGEVADLERELSKRRPVIVGVVKLYASGVAAQSLTHYEVVVGYHPEKKEVVTLDPAFGWRRNSLKGFAAEWDPTGRVTMVIFRSEETPRKN